MDIHFHRASAGHLSFGVSCVCRARWSTWVQLVALSVCIGLSRHSLMHHFLGLAHTQGLSLSSSHKSVLLSSDCAFRPAQSQSSALVAWYPNCQAHKRQRCPRFHPGLSLSNRQSQSSVAFLSIIARRKLTDLANFAQRLLIMEELPPLLRRSRSQAANSSSSFSN